MLEIAPNPTHYVTKALQKILKPLVNLLISSGITYPVFNELMKEIFVSVAEKDYKLPGKQQTDSRINFLTGIHRKDVKRLKNKKTADDHLVETPSLSALLISRWLGDPVYSDSQGQPRALARSIKQGDISFEGLVVSVNKDIRSRAILDEWINMKIVYMDNNNYVCLNQNAFIPDQGHEEKTWFFGENIRDHIASAVHNLKGNTPALLDRAVYYDQLSSVSAQELAELSEKLGMEALLKINNRALELQKRDKQGEVTKHRIRLGLYFYHASDKNKDANENQRD